MILFSGIRGSMAVEQLYLLTNCANNNFHVNAHLQMLKAPLQFEFVPEFLKV
jgi:hypothetical protein